MNKFRVVLLFVILTLPAACSKQSEKNGQTAISRVVFLSENYSVFIDTESELLAEPIELIRAGDGQFAVMDYGLNRIVLFDEYGNKTAEIGSTGSGPGEWNRMSGARNLLFTGEHFIVSNLGNFQFDIFDSAGEFIRSVTYPQYMNHQSVSVLENKKLVVASDGHDDALAVVIDLEKDGEILNRIGVPEAEAAEIPNFEKERLELASGELPERMKNHALVEAHDNGYILFMYATGELRNYNPEGELEWKSRIPEAITEPVFSLVREQNENGPVHSVFMLRYANDLFVQDDAVYLLTYAYPDLELEEQYLLRFDLHGELIGQYLLEPPAEHSMIVAMAAGEDGDYYFLDYTNAQIVHYKHQ
jgi:hypothetical protein